MIDADAVEERGHAPRRAGGSRRSRSARSRSQRYAGSPQSWPVALNASGGTPTDTSSMNSSARAQTSALSVPATNGRSPTDVDAMAGRIAPRLLPLLLGDPLPVLVPQDFARRSRRASSSARGSRSRSGAGQRATIACRRDRGNRLEERVVVEPPAFARDVAGKRRRRAASAAPIRPSGTRRTPGSSASSFAPAHRVVIDRRCDCARDRQIARDAVGRAPRCRPRAAKSGTGSTAM